MLARGSRHKCCGGGAPCVSDLIFHGGRTYRYDKVDNPAGSTPVDMTWDSVNSVMAISGDGSVTVKVTPNPNVISVETEVISLVSGSAGVTIRRVDSSDNISLWWMGGTSYELRQGSTVLESIVGSGSGKIKVELATPRDPTTDILVYIDDTLVHTEVGVTFVMPDVLNLGIIVNGEADFEGMEVSPCVGCEPVMPDCNPFPAPLAYKLEVEGIAGEEYNLPLNGQVAFICPDPDALYTLPYCDTFNGSYYLVPTVYTAVNEGPIWRCDQPHSGEWITPVGAMFPCEYRSVFRNSYVPGFENPVPQGYLAGLMKDICHISNVSSGGDESCSYPSDGAVWQIPPAPGNAQVQPAVRLWSHSIDLVNETIQFRMGFVDWQQTGSSPATYEGLSATYDSAVLPFSTDFLTTPITFNLVSSDGCSSMPSTLTLEPATDEEWDLVEWLSSCEPACEPPVTPQPGCMQVTLVDDANTPISYSVPMDVSYNETTGSWEWTGSIGPWEHPTCGTIPLSSYKIHCVEPQEGAAKQWVLDITTTNGTSRISLSDDPTFGPVFDGTANVFCSGETWDVFAIFPAAQEPETDIFGCEDTTCQLEGYCISGVASCDTGTCAQNSFGNFLGATSANPPGVASKIGDAFTGPYPIAAPAGRTMWLWRDGGGVHLGVYNGTTLIEEATPIDIDCDQGDKTFSLNDPAFACCSGFGGVTLTLTPCGGPIVHV